jgi:hypothetical protein
MSELHRWLADEAKLSGDKLDLARQLCDDAYITDLNDLRAMASKAHQGALAEIFPQMYLRRMIEQALNVNHTMPVGEPVFAGTAIVVDSASIPVVHPVAVSVVSNDGYEPGATFASYVAPGSSNYNSPQRLIVGGDHPVGSRTGIIDVKKIKGCWGNIWCCWQGFWPTNNDEFVTTSSLIFCCIPCADSGEVYTRIPGSSKFRCESKGVAFDFKNGYFSMEEHGCGPSWKCPFCVPECCLKPLD